VDGRGTLQDPALPWTSAGAGRTGPATAGRSRGTRTPPALPWGVDAGRPRGPAPRGGRGAVVRPVAALAIGAVAVLLLAVDVLAVRDAARTVSTPFLSYTAPSGWTPDLPDGAGPLDATGPLDVSALQGVVHGPGYVCAGETHVRGFTAPTLLPVAPALPAGPAERAERLARWFAATVYGGDRAAPEVTVAPSRPVRVRGPDGAVDGTVTEVTARAPARGECPATSGIVLALAAPAAGGAVVLLVAADTAGGPADPPPPDRAALDAVLVSARLGPG